MVFTEGIEVVIMALIGAEVMVDFMEEVIVAVVSTAVVM
jgi:hypothetical protein